MTSAIAPRESEAAPAEIESLKRELRQGLGQIVNGIRIAAAAVKRLDELGADFSDILISRELLAGLRRVAANQTLPEILERYGYNRRLFRRLAALPAADQQRVVQSGRVQVVVPGRNGALTCRMIAVDELTPAQVPQVFDDSGILGESAQKARLESPAANLPRDRRRVWWFDAETETLHCGTKVIAWSEVLKLRGRSEK